VKYLLASGRSNMKGYHDRETIWILSKRAKAVASGSMRCVLMDHHVYNFDPD
jgi:hypothetical protein